MQSIPLKDTVAFTFNPSPPPFRGVLASYFHYIRFYINFSSFLSRLLSLLTFHIFSLEFITYFIQPVLLQPSAFFRLVIAIYRLFLCTIFTSASIFYLLAISLRSWLPLYHFLFNSSFHLFPFLQFCCTVLRVISHCGPLLRLFRHQSHFLHPLKSVRD